MNKLSTERNRSNSSKQKNSINNSSSTTTTNNNSKSPKAISTLPPHLQLYCAVLQQRVVPLVEGPPCVHPVLPPVGHQGQATGKVQVQGEEALAAGGRRRLLLAVVDVPLLLKKKEKDKLAY